jgi:hypothetical protein
VPPVLLRCSTAGAFVALSLAAILGGAAVPRRFELRIPGEGAAAFVGNEIVLPQKRVRQLVIEITSPTAAEIDTGKIYPKINGEAASTISELRRTRRGLAIVLDLEMKPHLKLNPGTNTVEIVAENHRGRRFYQNWIVRLHVRSNHEWFTFELVDGPGESNPAPPRVEILSPLVPPVVERDATKVSVTVQANVIGYHPLESVAVDGVTDSAAAGKTQATIDRRLTVPSSRREVILRAVDVRGNETRVRIPIRKASSLPPPRLSGKRYLLSVGISDYQATSAGLPYLPGASTAAADLARLLVEQTGLAQDAILILRDRDATRARVRSALRDFVSRPGPEDLLIVYLSAYGLHGHGPESDRTYLACWDTRLDQLHQTALSLDTLARLLGDADQIRSRNVVLLFELRPVPGLDPGLTSNNLVNAHLLRLFSAKEGRTVLVSADVNQDSRSRQTSDGPQGLFAGALMEGLEGEADWNQDRILTVTELFHFVSERVKAESDGAQVPKYQIVDQAGVLGPLAPQ